MCNHHKNRIGSALEHGEAHEKDHRNWSRRTFMRNLGLAGGMSMLLNKVPLMAMPHNPLSRALANNNNDRILVLIRLKGGNDGLNTVIPLFDYDNYRNNRPTIAIPEGQVLNLSMEVGIPETMNALNPMWQEGKMKIVHNVGYEEQNLSHFRSSDIWAAANDSEEILASGWLGRFLEGRYPDFLENPPAQPPAVQIGGSGNLLFNNSEMTNMSVVVNDPQRLVEIAQNGEFYSTTDIPDCYYGDQLRYARITANSTFKYAEIIGDAYANGANAIEYTANPLSQQLSIVARLIKGNLGTKLYMVTLDGFDTHARQNEIHPYLMMTLADAISQFYQDLADAGWDKNVISMSYSEFGRRIEQNASGGTDHGAAAPMLLFGEGLNGNGFVGELPDLQDVDEVGNLKFDVDFRQVYATVLEDWLCVDTETVDSVLGGNYDRLADLGLTCNTITSVDALRNDLRHRAIYQTDGILIEYTLPQAQMVSIDIHNVMGQKVLTLFRGAQLNGQHQVLFSNQGMAKGIYVYTIQAGDQRVSRKVMVR